MNKIDMVLQENGYKNYDYSFEDLFVEEYSEEKILDYIDSEYQILCNSNRIVKMVNQVATKNKQGKGKRPLRTKYYNYSKNDEVLILKNDREQGVFNGEIMVLKSWKNGNATFDFRGRTIEYPVEELNTRIQPIFSYSIHKSQGSQMDRVCVLLDLDKDFLLSRNMIYTALSRAKQEVVVLYYSDKKITGEKKKAVLDSLKSEQANTDKYSFQDMDVLEKEYKKYLTTSNFQDISSLKDVKVSEESLSLLGVI